MQVEDVYLGLALGIIFGDGKETEQRAGHLRFWDLVFFFFQAEDCIRDVAVTGVQTCALPISTTALLFISWAVCFPIEIKGAQVTGPWAAWAGTYSGLAADSNDPASHNLFFTATLTTAGRASIKLQLGGKTSD